MKKPEPILWLSDARGIYIPRDFADIDRSRVAHVSVDNWEILESGPDHEWYWDAWDEVLCGAVVTDDRGQRYTLYQDGDLWLIPEDMEWSDREDWYVWPDEEHVGE